MIDWKKKVVATSAFGEQHSVEVLEILTQWVKVKIGGAYVLPIGIQGNNLFTDHAWKFENAKDTPPDEKCGEKASAEGFGPCELPKGHKGAHRITRLGPIPPEEAAKYNDIREKVKADLPDLTRQHHEHAETLATVETRGVVPGEWYYCPEMGLLHLWRIRLGASIVDYRCAAPTKPFDPNPYQYIKDFCAAVAAGTLVPLPDEMQPRPDPIIEDKRTPPPTFEHDWPPPKGTRFAYRRMGDKLFVGKMREDGSDFAHIQYTVDMTDMTNEAVSRHIGFAKLTVDTLNAYEERRNRVGAQPHVPALVERITKWVKSTCAPNMDFVLKDIAMLEKMANGQIIGNILDFAQLREANVKRNKHWDRHEKLDVAFSTVELNGEIGESIEEVMNLIGYGTMLAAAGGRLANVVKKLEREKRGLAGSRTSTMALALELADVIICADLLAMRAGIDLGKAVREKFNQTSAKLDLPVTL